MPWVVHAHGHAISVQLQPTPHVPSPTHQPLKGIPVKVMPPTESSRHDTAGTAYLRALGRVVLR